MGHLSQYFEEPRYRPSAITFERLLWRFYSQKKVRRRLYAYDAGVAQLSSEPAPSR
jgi:hypothetical protein